MCAVMLKCDRAFWFVQNARSIDLVFVWRDLCYSALSVSTGVHRAAGEDDRHAAESETGWPTDRTADPGSETRKANTRRDHHSARQHTAVRRSRAHVSLWDSITRDSGQVVHMNLKFIFFVAVSGLFFSQKKKSTISWQTNRRQRMRKLKNWRYQFMKWGAHDWRGLFDCALTMLCNLQQKKVYLERSVKEAEDNIREMLLSRRAQWLSPKHRIHYPI